MFGGRSKHSLYIKLSCCVCLFVVLLPEWCWRLMAMWLLIRFANWQYVICELAKCVINYSVRCVVDGVTSVVVVPFAERMRYTDCGDSGWNKRLVGLRNGEIEENWMQLLSTVSMFDRLWCVLADTHRQCFCSVILDRLIGSIADTSHNGHWQREMENKFEEGGFAWKSTRLKRTEQQEQKWPKMYILLLLFWLVAIYDLIRDRCWRDAVSAC